MTRFKELGRIEAAIEHGNSRELEWALGYCKMRLGLASRGIASRKDHQKYWDKLERRVKKALSQAGSNAE